LSIQQAEPTGLGAAVFIEYQERVTLYTTRGEMKMKTILWALILTLTLGFSFSCSTAKNTGEAVAEGTEEVAEEVGDKTEDVAQEVGDKAEDVGEATVDATKEAGETLEDGSITAAVKMRFANDEVVSAGKIDVDTSNGIVTLNGTVGSQAEADRAIELAQTVSGVKNVRSNLIVQRNQ
jgi:hyperosmotically inducible periplasmic protein